MIDSEFWKGKKVLVTGHTGFKGSWLSIWLVSMGAEVVGYALDPHTQNDNFVLSGLSKKMTDIRGDIRDKNALSLVFSKYRPEIVFHLAAQPLVRLSYEIPADTYEINVMGTINVMECMRATPESKIGVMITTDKCYENKEQIWGYREDDAMGGYDPYSSSKGAAELAISSWRRSFFNPSEYDRHGKSIASVRAGNVIGGGDWAKDRIIPDCIRAIEAGKPIEIRSPRSIRPWQHVLEPLSGYLLLAQKMDEDPLAYAAGWNFGPDMESVVPVWDVASLLVEHYGKGSLKDCSDPLAVHEAKLLALDITKARIELNWSPSLSSFDAVKLSVDWYLSYKTVDVFDFCVKQIELFRR